MLVKILVFLLAYKTSFAQINGEFWWLSDKVTKLKGLEAPHPKFEELSEFDTDESAKIIFRDDYTDDKDHADNVEKNLYSKTEDNHLENSIKFPDESLRQLQLSINGDQLLSSSNTEITTQRIISDTTQNTGDIFIFKFPDDENVVVKQQFAEDLQENLESSNISEKPMPRDDESNRNKTTEKPIHDEDVFTFIFPDDNFVLKNSTHPLENPASTNLLIDNSNEIINPKRDNPEISETKKSLLSEDICFYMIKNECYQRNGIVYTFKKARVRSLINSRLICCVLPLSTEVDSHKIVFPDSPEVQSKRSRRSNKDDSANRAQRQREFLIEQRFRPQNTKPTVQTRVVTPDDDDYIDPYLNIKGTSNVKKYNALSTSKKDCNDPDYVDDYTVELPKPGLIGLYSDYGQRQPSYNMYDNNRPVYGGATNFDESEEDEEPSFGYSTFDPRKGTTKAPKRGRPSKFTTSLPNEAYEVESQTVSFQSTPNFQVLQGFKLLNLGRNKNKFYTKNTRRSTTEGSLEGDIETAGSSSNSIMDSQVYENCGKTRKVDDAERNDKPSGEAESGSHPWMALVVLTRRPQGILCYATIVHPRAAVTAGDCVYGRTSPKEVILIAGLWNLNDRTQTQNRVVTVQLHPQYRPKVLAHDLALLHWKTPLRLNVNIQPACLASNHDAADCKFYGWGGFDQGIRIKSRWQRASVLSSQECSTRLAKAISMPDDAFCATVQTRGTVTGIGGPLMCNVNGRKASSGVAIWRDNALVLIPAQEWILRAFQDLNIQ